MLTGILEIDQEDYERHLRFTIRNGGNLLVLGAAGTGKTEMSMQVCNDLGYQYQYLNLAVLEAPDLMGLPIVDTKTSTTRYALPEMFPSKGKDKPVVLIVDELDKAQPELQNPCLELFQFRSINGRPVNIHAVIATGNLPDENAFSRPISHALTNRCQVFKLIHTFKPWRDWAVNSSINPLVVAFLEKNQDKLLQSPPEGDDTAYCHPSPRAWALAARDLDNTSKDDNIEFQTALIAGRVGHAAAVEFRIWLEHYRHIEPLIDTLVNDGIHPNTEKMTIDRQLVCAIGAVRRIMDTCKEAPRGVRANSRVATAHKRKVHQVCTNVMGWINELPSEFSVGALKSSLNMKVINKFKLMDVKPFLDTYVDIREALDRE